MDSDSLEDIHNRADYILNSDIDAIQSTIMTPLPGTRLFKKMEKEERLLYSNFPKDWERYFFMEVVHRPKLMEPEEFMIAMHEIWGRLYDEKVMLKKLIKSIKTTKNPKAAVWAYYANVERHNLTLSKNMKPVNVENMLAGLR